jgi:DNA segregation ATPase FtsK/SpoIIIE, S-DNA-T family
MKAPLPVKNSKKAADRVPAPKKQPARGWVDQLADFWLHFGRFGWDIAGVILLVFALVSLLGWIGLTKGQAITLWVGLLKYGFGWGTFFPILFLGLLGLLALRRRFDVFSSLDLKKVLALEGFSFCVLALITLFGGMSLENATHGQDGGVVGWGLARLFTLILPVPLAIIILLLLGVYFLLVGIGLSQLVRSKFERWLFPFGKDEPQEELPVKINRPLPVAQKENPIRKAAPLQIEPNRPAPVLLRDDRLPPYNLLTQEQAVRPDEEHIHEMAGQIEKTLAEFGVPAKVVGYRIGPTVTQYAVEPGFIEKPGPDGELLHQKVRVSQISTLSRDLALALSAERLRIEAPVPGRSYLGIEVPNSQSTVVRLRAMLESEPFNRLGSPLAIALGRDVSGLPVVADLTKMPHLLIAGTTGSGKSVCIAALTACMVMNNTPEELRIAMLDPKMVELVRFNGLPHLLGQVETDINRMLGVLRWALLEMDHRYRLLEENHVRDLEGYNRKMARRKQQALPRIVVMIDELADLMMSAPDQTEHSLIRLAQMARATGIHLVVATQRPSTDVVTGLIKANFPARISFTVASSVDSRVILDSNGAETLLGRGDMLFLSPEVGSLQRAQGVMVTDTEIEKVIGFWQKMAPKEENAPPWEDLLDDVADSADNLVDQAVKFVRQSQRASASLLQRRLRIGYPRAARLMDELEEMGVVGPNLGAGREREVLLPPEEGDEEEAETEVGEEEE